MNVKSDEGSRQRHNTTNLVIIPCVPNGKSRNRVGVGGESCMGKGKFLPASRGGERDI